jgi:broad specificity phosphatase PhoE
VLIVTHGGAISEVRRHFGLGPYTPWQVDAPPIQNTSRTMLRLANGGDSAELLLPPDTSHLPPELITQ